MLSAEAIFQSPNQIKSKDTFYLIKSVNGYNYLFKKFFVLNLVMSMNMISDIFRDQNDI